MSSFPPQAMTLEVQEVLWGREQDRAWALTSATWGSVKGNLRVPAKPHLSQPQQPLLLNWVYHSIYSSRLRGSPPPLSMDTRAEKDGILSQEGKCASQLLASLAGKAVVTWIRPVSFCPRRNSRTGWRRQLPISGDPVEVTVQAEFPKVMRSLSRKVFKHSFGGVVKKIQVSDGTFR